jgi:hypothetical protein
MSAQEAVGERFSLTMRTSELSEFRTARGVLVMFEIAGHRTTFGQLCASLAQIPGVEFADRRVPALFGGPARFRLKGQDYEVSIAHFDYRIVARNAATAASTTDELLAQVKQMLAPRKRASLHL